MNAKRHNPALLHYALSLADDALILGHRLSEWCSNAPFLEEDIALGNIALDHIGRARLYYQYAAGLSGQRSEDELAFLRDARQFRNLLVYELPRGDFAFTIVRQLLSDHYNRYYLQQLQRSRDATLAAIADKAQKETQYHLRHSGNWALKLGDGTDESHRRMQRAVDELWGFTHEMFEIDDDVRALVEGGIAVDPAAFKAAWQADVSGLLHQATLALPQQQWAVRGGRKGYHTEHLGHLLSHMQSVHRAHPGCQW